MWGLVLLYTGLTDSDSLSTDSLRGSVGSVAVKGIERYPGKEAGGAKALRPGEQQDGEPNAAHLPEVPAGRTHARYSSWVDARGF